MRYRAFILMLLLVIGHAGFAEEGTILYGAKLWYNYWDSAALKNFEKGLTRGLESAGASVETDRPVGRGFLMGPMYAYQSPSGQWSASLALMMLSEYTQDFSGTADGTPIDVYNVLRRRDLDFAISYSPLRYLSVFLGYKHLLFSIDNYASIGLLGQPLVIASEGSARIPTIGVGVAYPLTDRISLGAQAGLRYSVWKVHQIDGVTSAEIEADFENSYGVAGEVTATYLPWDNLLVQLGYRFDWMRVHQDKGKITELRSDDISHGPTIAVLFVR